ncbi:hypothetical protein RB12408 [Rhodopirellula baltica SH 1]|uniref:Uncharacterized protein n=1 Tax=Rhodopirellula baltica (strain DSM 10527 / NCIMB 13988 / SH1) TaxID=243090 RepID=Q7UIP5_RHOBA|nr:hypothetical protein RB12408 [Rhodopirellula baltica SH 1]
MLDEQAWRTRVETAEPRGWILRYDGARDVTASRLAEPRHFGWTIAYSAISLFQPYRALT